MSNIFYDENYIRVVDNVLTSDQCDTLIDFLETSPHLWYETPTRLIEVGIWNVHNPLRQPLTDSLMDVVREQHNNYSSRWDPLNMMPKRYATEGFRVKLYKPYEHEFKLHVDQGDQETATRFLAFLFYLNDSEAGTEFPEYNLTVEAKKGRVTMFPPMWMYPHRGIMPTLKNKYIMSTYLFYV